MNIRKNDHVIVISGVHKGKKGKVLKVFPKENRILIEGVNIIKRHTRPSQKNPQGGIIEKEAPIHASNAMIICGKCNSKTRIAKKVLKDKRIVRVCRNCGEMLATNI
ncbi:50S ribosomal protein L24 [candidate division KSB1 bacterium]|nr:MAG: 50S ribosomal protein L24 [candidate division KSB1 bacterium]